MVRGAGAALAARGRRWLRPCGHADRCWLIVWQAFRGGGCSARCPLAWSAELWDVLNAVYNLKNWDWLEGKKIAPVCNYF